MSFGQNALGTTNIVIPIYNAERHLDKLLPALERQGLSPGQFLIIDSSSTDESPSRFVKFGARLHVIPQSEFDHGGTRRLAASLCADVDFLIYLTQDAVPVSTEAFIRLLNVFQNPKVGVAYGRQLPRPEARAIERHARLVNYPVQDSEVRTFEDRRRLGIKTVFSSDSFAAYRRSALEEVGGFPERAFFAEDQIVAAKMLAAGWSTAYCADAEVIHSHGYTIQQDLQRYFDVGVFHSRNHWILEMFGAAEGAGLKFIISELRYLAAREPLSIPSAIARTFAKYLGYRLGRMEAQFSPALKSRLSMAPYYWKKANSP